MFETAVAVGLYHKSDNTININPDDTVVFQPGDQIVALSNTGDSYAFSPCSQWSKGSTLCHSLTAAACLSFCTLWL